MLKVENVEVVGWAHTIRGMRNAKNSWAMSDSEYGCEEVPGSYRLCRECPPERKAAYQGKPVYVIGPNDHTLMMTLRNAGADHRKFMRFIDVYMDITAPLYWWKEFETYRIGVAENPSDIEMISCSTMHKLAAKEFTLDDFSHENLIDYSLYACDESECLVLQGVPHIQCGGVQQLNMIIDALNFYRQKYLETRHILSKNEKARQELAKKYWWQMIQLLPSSYNQLRTLKVAYEALANMYKARKNHKLDEWRMFCNWIEGLPYSELITGKEKEGESK